MTERPMMGERPKLTEVKLPVDTVKELADLIPKPEDHYHYRITGTWKPNQEVFQVNEGDGVVSDYSFPEKADMNVVQFASRKTYVKELNMFGSVKDKKVQFDRKTGKWKKLNFIQEIKSHFHKVDNIPGQVVDEDGKFVLHTLEAKRPVGNTVKEAELTTLQDAKVELGLKYKHAEHTINILVAKNMALEQAVSRAQSEIYSLERQLSLQQRDRSRASYEEERRKTMETEHRIADAKQKAADARLDAEYKDWVEHHPDKAYYVNSGKPFPSKADYVAMKAQQVADRKANREAEERGLAKD